MLLDYRSLVEVGTEEFIGAHTGTAAAATVAAMGAVLNPTPPLPVFTSGPGPRLPPEPVLIVGYGINVAAMATAHAVGEVRPPAVDNTLALALLGVGDDALALVL